jgi:DNA-binding PucR family transcriptional regulator
LQTYLYCFGDVAAAAAELQVHPNTIRYRIRRLEKLLETSMADPDARLLLGLSLRALP